MFRRINDPDGAPDDPLDAGPSAGRSTDTSRSSHSLRSVHTARIGWRVDPGAGGAGERRTCSRAGCVDPVGIAGISIAAWVEHPFAGFEVAIAVLTSLIMIGIRMYLIHATGNTERLVRQLLAPAEAGRVST